MESPVHAGEPAPLPWQGGSGPLAPTPGPTLGTRVQGRCAGPEPRAFWGRGGVGSGARAPRPGRRGERPGAQAMSRGPAG